VCDIAAVKPNRAALPRRHPPVGPRLRGDNAPGGPRPEGPPLKVRIIGSEPMPESDFGQELRILSNIAKTEENLGKTE